MLNKLINEYEFSEVGKIYIDENNDVNYKLFEKNLQNEKEGIFSPQPIKLFRKKSRFESVEGITVSNFDLELFNETNFQKKEEDLRKSSLYGVAYAE